MLQNLWNILYLFVTSMLVWSLNSIHHYSHWASQVAVVAKNTPANAGDTGDMGSVPGLGRSPEGGNCNLLQYSCLKNSMDKEAWQATVHGLTQNRTQVKQLSSSTRHFMRKNKGGSTK